MKEIKNGRLAQFSAFGMVSSLCVVADVQVAPYPHSLVSLVAFSERGLMNYHIWTVRAGFFVQAIVTGKGPIQNLEVRLFAEQPFIAL